METFLNGRSNCGSARSGRTSSSGRCGSGRKMESLNRMTEQLAAAAPFIGTALFGCLLQAFKSPRWPGWRNFAASAMSAGFGAWLVFQLVGDVLSPGWGHIASGMIGYSGGALVDVMLAVFTRKVEKLDIPAGSPSKDDADD